MQYILLIIVDSRKYVEISIKQIKCDVSADWSLTHKVSVHKLGFRALTKRTRDPEC